MPMTLDGTAGMTAPQGAVYNGLATAAAQASTSGTSIDFTGVPVWVKRITIMFNGVSTNGSNNYLVQIGSGTVTTSGYASSASRFGGGTLSSASSTSGFLINGVAATTLLSGTVSLVNITGNTWVASVTVADTNGGSSGLYTVLGGGNLLLSGTLDRVRITTVGGTDTFDAGSINIMYE